MVWAYIENGADDERTLRENRAAYRDWYLSQRVLTRTADVDLTTTVAGTRLGLPVVVAPVGLAGAAHWHGDLGLARAAEQNGTRMVLSSASTYGIEEVARGAGAHHWFQLYPWRNRSLMASLLDRARDSGYTALFVTVDVPVYGNRLRERRTGMGIPPTLTPRRVLEAALRPRWVYGYLRHRRTTLRNLVSDGARADSVGSVEVQSENLTADIGWDDLEWIRSRWDGPLFVKGVLHPDDAERVVDLGADGVVVSNHGGRQLNAVQPTVRALPAVVRRVGHRAEVLVDGGIRSGADAVVAVALGARACLVGRPAVYGLAGGGERGVAAVLRILREEMVRALTMMGVSGPGELTPAHLTPVGDRAD
ncbi:alpha-hydroxy-acid oxidizing protein [Thermobifida halotolerans]|uniref:Alpha-hydroxy-acid oxidizing protein n=2 Tax=Thermobifida halotolerans TaxID=483545 RepID=A0AA97M1U0_9ACTN|nr:alpha-hydroxy-acid oxidizing protein [Thermobifida halotolerans]